MRYRWLVFMIPLLFGMGCEPRATSLATATIYSHDQPLQLELATTKAQQEQGLSGRDPLPPGTGMLFVFSQKEYQTFWMKEMRFPLDIIWIDGRIIKGIERSVPAPKTLTESPALVRSRVPVDRVLEVTAGEADRLHLVEGMSLDQLP